MAIREHLKQPTKSELQDKVSRLERELDAHQRWFWHVERGAEPTVLDIRMEQRGEPDQLFRVTVFGMDAPHGGIAVIRDINESYSTNPEYLDDMCARMERSVHWEFRDAARKLRIARNQQLESKTA